ncbi:hypothetical protein Smic_11780 [Streptomyces microflavus]|uniref:Uncharacterized protein n=1 Tax=Streptomyces microflavus TaxID=1919 RepID=A0A7J0CJF9_STRMI|nr:hypothetical protein Smic_11780 [Streptomyces microflavus]
MDAFEEEGQFGGARARRGEDGDLVVRPADVDGAAQGARVGDDDLGVVPGHSGPREGGGHGGDGGDDFDFEAVFGGAQGADDAEEAGVAVGEDDGAAAVAGDAAGGQVDAAEPDALGARGHFGQGEVVCGARDERGGRERGRGRSGQWRAVPADHRDPVGHRRLSPGVSEGAGLRSARWRAGVRVPGPDRGPAGGPVPGVRGYFQSLYVP